jgi:hypothetical protein
LPPHERLRLAALVLDDLSRNATSLNFSDDWSEEDQHDLAAFSLSHAMNTYEGDEEIA